jgi:large subunit ribosomal protein L3
MAEGLMGRKRGMTQVFTEKGQIVPVTVLEVGPCYVTQIHTNEKDGYSSIQLGYGETRRLNKPERGHLKNIPSLKHLREVRTTQLDKYQVGQKLNASLFAVGEKVDVVGTSKGKGTAGAVKKNHFRGGPKTHGQSDRTRRPGSSSATTTPGRVLKGTRRAGQMGNVRVTISNLDVIQVDPERNLVTVRGAVPGPKSGLIFVQKARKQPKGKK